MNIAFFLHPKNNVAYIYDDNSIRQGLEKMRHKGFSAVPVITRQGKYCGTISEGDFLWHIVSNTDNLDEKYFRGTKIRDILTDDKYPPVTITSSIDELLHRAMNQNFVPVIDDFDIFMGLITRKDIIKYFCDKNNTKITLSK